MENEVTHLAYRRRVVAERKALFTEAEAKLHASPVMRKDRELTRMRGAAQEQGVELAQARDELAAISTVLHSAKKRARANEKCHTQIRKELVQANRELKGLQGANRALVQQLADIKGNRDYWHETCLTAEAERSEWRRKAQAQSDDAQANWLGPGEAEGLQQELAYIQRQLAAASEAAEWLWGFYDGNTLIAKPGYEDDIQEAWGKLLVAADSTPEALQMQERLSILNAAEKALAECGITGILAPFENPADAIRQMAVNIKELHEELEGKPIVVEITGQEMVEALQHERALRQVAETGERAARKMLAHERKLRQEVELIAHDRDNICHEEYSRRLEAERHYETALMAAHSRGERLEKAEQRADRNKALARLVNKETAVLLERLAWLAAASHSSYEADMANTLAAQIREALDDSQA